MNHPSLRTLSTCIPIIRHYAPPEGPNAPGRTWYLLLTILCGLLFCPDTTVAKKKKPHEQLAVFDSQATKVGILEDEYNNDPSSLWVTVTLEGYPIVLHVTRDALEGPKHVEALYLSGDCSGDPFFRHSQILRGNTMAPLTFIAQPDQTVYMAAQADRSIFLAAQSKRKAGGQCETLPAGSLVKLRPGLRLADLPRLFHPPFSIR